jgi:hypothetical protein
LIPAGTRVLSQTKSPPPSHNRAGCRKGIKKLVASLMFQL